MQRLLIVLGTRPEAIKLAPLILAARNDNRFEARVLVTAQHREMMDSVLAFFGIVPDNDLDLMRPGQTLGRVTCGVLEGMDAALQAVRPDWLIVQGDTTTTFAASLAAYYQKIPVAHVEAGLRTGNIYEPWPEEMNRKMVSVIAALHFPPTELARENLLKEGITEDRITVTGNTGIDALLLVSQRLREDVRCSAMLMQQLAENNIDDIFESRRRLVLITAHRRESFGAGFDEICAGVRMLCEQHPNVEFVFPVHPNPAVRTAVDKWLTTAGLKNLRMTKPLDYLPFVALMQRASVVLTDSGGVQEEAPSIGKPVVVMRDETERREGLTSGLVHLTGPHRERIVAAVTRLLAGSDAIGKAGNFYGDGKASARILERIAGHKVR